MNSPHTHTPMPSSVLITEAHSSQQLTETPTTCQGAENKRVSWKTDFSVHTEHDTSQGRFDPFSQPSLKPADLWPLWRMLMEPSDFSVRKLAGLAETVTTKKTKTGTYRKLVKASDHRDDRQLSEVSPCVSLYLCGNKLD